MHLGQKFLSRMIAAFHARSLPRGAAPPRGNLIRKAGSHIQGAEDSPLEMASSGDDAATAVDMSHDTQEEDHNPKALPKSCAEEKVDARKQREETDRRREGEWFHLTGVCALVLHRGDITKWHVDGKTDAIVNAANEGMLGGGGVDGAIHRAAGRELLEACFKVPEVSKGSRVRCPVGNAVITPGFKLPASRVIHTVGPMYSRKESPAKLLASAYKNSVALALEEGVKYVAFPAISCGIYGYPYDEAAKVSIQALQETAGHLTEVHFVLFELDSYRAWLAEAKKKLDRPRS